LNQRANFKGCEIEGRGRQSCEILRNLIYVLPTHFKKITQFLKVLNIDMSKYGLKRGLGRGRGIRGGGRRNRNTGPCGKGGPGYGRGGGRGKGRYRL